MVMDSNTHNIERWISIGSTKRVEYFISDHGNLKSVYNDGKEIVLKGCLHPKGYRKVKTPVTNEYLIHRMVAKAFLPNPHGLKSVNHKDGNKLNNHVLNLEWLSLSDNNKHAAQILGVTKMFPVKVYTKSGLHLGDFQSENFVRKNFNGLAGLILKRI